MHSAAQDALDRIAGATRRLDELSEFDYQAAKRKLAEWRADDADPEQERRDRVRRWDEACACHAARYEPDREDSEERVSLVDFYLRGHGERQHAVREGGITQPDGTRIAAQLLS
jgi:hypothetical protein